MSNEAEIHLLKARLAELEETVEIIDKGQTRQEEKLRDRLACAFAASGCDPDEIYAAADLALIKRGEK